MGKKIKRIIDFNPEGMLGLHFYVEGLNFPMAVGTYSKWEETQVSYLSNNIRNRNWDTEDICQWCIKHNIQYRIIYPIRKSCIVKHPCKFYKFLQLKQQLKKTC